jgi:predicted nucleic acid-binding protein
LKLLSGIVSLVLVDTSALIAFFVGSKKYHHSIKSYFLQNPGARWVILSSVFDETVTWLRVKVSIQASIQVGHLLRKEHLYIHLSDDDDLATWETFCRYDDKFWSYTDCSLLVMAQRLNVLNVAAFDEHIRQMAGLGITCIP